MESLTLRVELRNERPLKAMFLIFTEKRNHVGQAFHQIGGSGGICLWEPAQKASKTIPNFSEYKGVRRIP